MAAAISGRLNGPAAGLWFFLQPTYQPNKLVYDEMCRALRAADNGKEKTKCRTRKNLLQK